MNEATGILFDAIETYARPLLQAGGLDIDMYGYIVDKNGKKLCMKNLRYEKDPENESPVLYPVVPITDEDYLSIKEKPDHEIFNPFQNVKHAIIIAVKIKKHAVVELDSKTVAVAMGLENDLLLDEDDYARFDDYIGLSNDINNMGQIDYALVDMSLETKPEILRYPCGQDEPCKGLWGLSVLVYNKYITCRPPFLKQFQDIEKSWKKIVAKMNKWDVAKKKIVLNVKTEKNESFNTDYMDLSESVTPGSAVSMFTMPKELTAEDFTDDFGDIFEITQGQQDFLTSLFAKEDLKPVEDIDPDEQEETVFQTIKVEGTVDIPKKKSFDDLEKVKVDSGNIENPDTVHVVEYEPGMTVEEARSKAVEVPFSEMMTHTKAPVEDKPQQTNSVFKKSKDGSTSLNFNNQNTFGNMFGGYGMGNFNPNWQNNMPSMDVNDLDLYGNSFIDPYAAYRR